MTIIDLGTVKIRFDPQDIRVSIDGDKIDVGVREKQVLPEINDVGWATPGIFTLKDPDDIIMRKEFTQKTGTNCVMDTKGNKLDEVLTLSELNRKINELNIEELRNSSLKPVVKKELDKLEKKIRKKTKYRPE